MFSAPAWGFFELPPTFTACRNAASVAARPLRARERSIAELFGDYDPDTLVIRVWKRTAIRKEITSFGTFLSDSVSRVLSSPGFPPVRIPRFLAHSRIL